MVILIMLIWPANVKGIWDHLCRSNVVMTSNFWKFSLYRPAKVLVMLIPIYLNWVEILKGNLSKSCWSFMVFIGNNILLLTFILYPDSCPNLFKIEIIAGTDLEGSEMYINKSLGNSETLCSLPPRWIPLYSFEARKETARGSIASAKSSRDSGHPCLVERVNLKYSDLILFVCTEAIGGA